MAATFSKRPPGRADRYLPSFWASATASTVCRSAGVAHVFQTQLVWSCVNQTVDASDLEPFSWTSAALAFYVHK
jgi:hypothetical protein